MLTGLWIVLGVGLPVFLWSVGGRRKPVAPCSDPRDLAWMVLLAFVLAWVAAGVFASQIDFDFRFDF